MVKDQYISGFFFLRLPLVKDAVKVALQGLEELQGATRETIQSGNHEALKSLYPGPLRKRFKEPAYGFQFRHALRGLLRSKLALSEALYGAH